MDFIVVSLSVILVEDPSGQVVLLARHTVYFCSR